jgi:hypothetical protein
LALVAEPALAELSFGKYFEITDRGNNAFASLGSAGAGCGLTTTLCGSARSWATMAGDGVMGVSAGA